MKHIIKIAILVALAAPVNAGEIPIEKGAHISASGGYSKATLMTLIPPAVGLVRIRGWRCDSISSFRPFLFSKGYTLICNNFSYTYEIADKGGNWVVELK